jgi:transposase
MFYVGLDVHWRRSSICILDENGKTVKEQTIHGDWQRVLETIQQLERPLAICYEASGGYGWWYDRLRRIAHKVQVAHPGRLRLIFRSKRKNDRVDAAKLATLLFLDQVPTAWVPSVDVRQWRSLIEFRSRTVAKRTAVKNAIRRLLRSNGLRGPRGLFSKKGLTWLSQQPLDSADACQRDLLIEELAHHHAQILRLERELNRIGREHPGVALLQTIPGVGPRTAEAVVAWIDRADRFGRNKAVGAYFGLVPCQDSSAGKDRLGHITREGPATVRRLLAEASWQAIRRSPTVKAYFVRTGGETPGRRNIALVATAHYLLRVMHAMLRGGECWRETPAA